MAGLCVVVVDDNRFNLKALQGMVRRRGFTPCGSPSYEAARAQIECLREPPAGAVIDVCLDRGRLGFELAHLLRGRFSRPVPVMMFTGYSVNSLEFQRRALDLDVELFGKPVSMTQLTDFLVRAAIRLLQLQPALQQAVAALAVDYGLSPQEVRIVGQLGAGTSRSKLPSCLGLSGDTVKWQIKRLLAKTDTKSTSELLAMLLRRVGAYTHVDSRELKSGRPSRSPDAQRVVTTSDNYPGA